jgi:Pentapeptide repeats (8 copies)
MTDSAHYRVLQQGVTKWNKWREERSTHVDELGYILGDADLNHADLRGLDLRGMDFSFANLQNADLSGFDFSNADFTCAQALATNFRGAIFTGACIEDWHVNSDTNLTEIICDYVYQKKDRQERRPSSGNFQPGDFTRLYQKAIETLDLIFQNGIDWKSFAVTLQELNADRKLNVEDENSQLTVRAIEKRDDGSFVIRVDVPISIDKAEIELEFNKKYTKQLKAQEEQYHQLLQAKDIDIEYHRQQNTSLTNIIATLASREITVNNNLEITTMTSSESKGDTYNQSNMGIGHVSGGDFKDNKIAGTINEAANSSLADAAAEIRDLLTELEKSYPANTTTEKMVIATKAIERIEADPAWQKRTVNALKLGSVAAFEKAIDNPIGAFLKGAFEGWENAK